MGDLLILITLLILTYFTGSILEKKHFKKIQQRELLLVRKPIISFGAKKWATRKPIKNVQLVTGEVVISGDYFKNFVASMKNMFGGKLTSFESIMDRARREAILRMREKVPNANIIVNTRLETVMLNRQLANEIPKCAIIAYGTAVTYADKK